MYFSRTFKALNFDFQIQGLSRTFKVRANPVQVIIVFELRALDIVSHWVPNCFENKSITTLQIL